MARSAVTDYLRVHPFWLFEVPRSVRGAAPFLNPLAGFSSITAPEITLETKEIVDGTSLFTRHAVKRGSIGNLTLTRGAKFTDQDFYRWIVHTLRGSTLGTLRTATPRRSLVLVQFLTHYGSELQLPDSAGGFLTGMVDLPPARVPARAWLLRNCLPVRYKSGGDFEASSSDISVMELEIATDDMIQVTLGGAI